MAHWAVRRGQTRGVFPTLKEALSAVRDFPHASQAPFDEEDDAWAFVLARQVHACCTTVYKPPSMFDSEQRGGSAGAGWAYGVAWTERAFEGPRWEEAGFLSGDYASGVEHAEFVAILRALELCPDKGDAVVISTSSKAAYHALKAKVAPTSAMIEPPQTGSPMSASERFDDILRRIQSACERMAHWPRFELCPLYEDKACMRRAYRMAWDAAYDSHLHPHGPQSQPQSRTPALTPGNFPGRATWAARLQLAEDDDGLITPKSSADSAYLFSPFSSTMPPASGAPLSSASTFATSSATPEERSNPFSPSSTSATVAPVDSGRGSSPQRPQLGPRRGRQFQIRRGLHRTASSTSSLNMRVHAFDEDDVIFRQGDTNLVRSSLAFYSSLLNGSTQALGTSCLPVARDGSDSTNSPPSSDSDSDSDLGESSSEDEGDGDHRELEGEGSSVPAGAHPLQSEDEEEDNEYHRDQVLRRAAQSRRPSLENGRQHDGASQVAQSAEGGQQVQDDTDSLKSSSRHGPSSYTGRRSLKLEDLIQFEGDDVDDSKAKADQNGAGIVSPTPTGVEEQVKKAMEEDGLLLHRCPRRE
ncbi:hypothetical protein CF319_g4988 [Tilletia indica]|nr:hypothetical protein CF319_g4988 [Tilletia indica]